MYGKKWKGVSTFCRKSLQLVRSSSFQIKSKKPYPINDSLLSILLPFNSLSQFTFTGLLTKQFGFSLFSQYLEQNPYILQWKNNYSCGKIGIHPSSHVNKISNGWARNLLKWGHAWLIVCLIDLDRAVLGTNLSTPCLVTRLITYNDDIEHGWQTFKFSLAKIMDKLQKTP